MVDGAWIDGDMPAPRPLYWLPELLAAPGAEVLIVEGERTAEAAAAILREYAVTTSPGGAASAARADWSPLAGRRVVCWPDADDPGQQYAADVARLAAAAGAAEVRIVDLPPGLPAGWDLADALPAGWTVETVRELLAAARPAGDTGGLRVVTVAELLALDIAPREMVLAPWLPSQGLAMIYGPRGTGKTYLTLAVALAIAGGAELLAWRAPRPRRVLYLDGEMPAVTMRERLARLIRGAGIDAPPDHLRIITPDLQVGPMPDLSTAAGRESLAPYIAEADVVIVDSISTLTSSAESEADDWLTIQRWALDLRRAGRTLLFVHHAGKAGQQRGTSRREDVLDTVLALRRPADYRAEQGARAEVLVEKGRGVHGDDARTIEVALADDGAGGLRWTYRPIEDALTHRVAELARDGLTQRQIAAELRIGLATVNRHLRRGDDS
jgi:putative DNA primase/helicase